MRPGQKKRNFMPYIYTYIQLHVHSWNNFKHSVCTSVWTQLDPGSQILDPMKEPCQSADKALLLQSMNDNKKGFEHVVQALLHLSLSSAR